MSSPVPMETTVAIETSVTSGTSKEDSAPSENQTQHESPTSNSSPNENSVPSEETMPGGIPFPNFRQPPMANGVSGPKIPAETPFKCDKCSYETLWEFALKGHADLCSFMTLCASEPSLNNPSFGWTYYECPHCDFRTKWQVEQERHFEYHRQFGEKEKLFWNTSVLLQDIRELGVNTSLTTFNWKRLPKAVTGLSGPATTQTKRGAAARPKRNVRRSKLAANDKGSDAEENVLSDADGDEDDDWSDGGQKKSKRALAPKRNSRKSNVQAKKTVPNNDTIKVITQPTARFSCGKCTNVFATQAMLNQHMISHITETTESFGCAICGKRFITREILKDHVDKSHVVTGKVPALPINDSLKCGHCNFIAINPQVLQTHVKEKHPEAIIEKGGTLAQCPRCKFSTNDESKLKAHKHQHFLDERKMFHCKHCSFTSHSPNSFKMHLRQMHEKIFNAENFFLSYLCAECPTHSDTIELFEEHIKIHQAPVIKAERDNGEPEEEDDDEDDIPLKALPNNFVNVDEVFCKPDEDMDEDTMTLAPPSAVTKEQFKCTTCTFITDNVNEFVDHKKSHSKDALEDEHTSKETTVVETKVSPKGKRSSAAADNGTVSKRPSRQKKRPRYNDDDWEIGDDM